MEISGFCCHLDFTWNQIFSFFLKLENAILIILEALNLDFGKFLPLRKRKNTSKSVIRVSWNVKMTIFETLTSQKCHFTWNLCCRKIMKFSHCDLGTRLLKSCYLHLNLKYNMAKMKAITTKTMATTPTVSKVLRPLLEAALARPPTTLPRSWPALLLAPKLGLWKRL